VLILWILAVVVISGIGSSMGNNWNDKFDAGNSDSGKALHLLQDRFPSRAGDTADMVFHSKGDITSPANQAAVNGVVADVAALGLRDHVESVQSPFTKGGEGQVANVAPGKGHVVYARIQFDRETNDIPTAAIKKVLSTARHATPSDLQIEFGGGPVYKAEPPSMGSAELIGVVAAIFILLIAFGSLIAMGLPLLTAFFGIGIGSAIVTMLSHSLTVPSFALQMAMMIGIGVGIDYALFIVTRYRSELHDGSGPRDAVITALATAGHAVLFAGCTVVISLIGMLLLGQSFIYGLAFGCIGVVVMVMLSAMTLLPAILGFVGRTIDRLHVPGLLHKGEQATARRTFWYRWSRVVQRKPWVTGSVALVILIALALPLFGMRMGQSDAGSNPASSTTRKSYDLLAQGFGAGSNGPLFIAVDQPKTAAGSAAAGKLYDAFAALSEQPDSNVAYVAKPRLNPSGDAAQIIVVPLAAPQDKATDSLVHRLRDHVIPDALRGTGAKAYVGGVTAGGIDGTAGLTKKLPWVIGGVVLLSFLLLMAVFRSVAVPIKAAVMNLLSIGAAYGVIVAVFQWGWGASIIGVSRTGPIDSWIPLMLFTILFGLSMDYEVFLLSRIREEWLGHGDNGVAVADGLAGTARVITAAAAIMVFVFGSFVLGDMRQLKLFGLGLATAILVDATLVRMVLVPSTMELIGDANWWFPRWLDRLVPKLSVEVDADAHLPSGTTSPAPGQPGGDERDPALVP
jgi:RND superfamily putative drug exporter